MKKELPQIIRTTEVLSPELKKIRELNDLTSIFIYLFKNIYYVVFQEDILKSLKGKCTFSYTVYNFNFKRSLF